MTRAEVWDVLQTAVPGIIRTPRIATDAPAVIMTEVMTQRSDHRTDSIALGIVVPVRRMPDGLEEDARIKALRRACLEQRWEHTYVLGSSDDWGGPIYTFTLTAVVIKDALA